MAVSRGFDGFTSFNPSYVLAPQYELDLGYCSTKLILLVKRQTSVRSVQYGSESQKAFAQKFRGR